MRGPESADLLRLVERITLAVQLGESHFREFKSAQEGPPGEKRPRPRQHIAKDIAETLVAFANADGGELLVGVEDDGTITGVVVTGEQLEYLLSSWKTGVHAETPLPSVRALSAEIEGKRVVYFAVQKSVDFIHQTADGRCLQRRDRESLPISAERLALSRAETASREYDRQFVDGAEVADLDLTLVGEIADQISRGMSAEKCLQHLDLAEFDGSKLRLRRAALLLFARNVSKWHPRSQVRVLKIEGTQLKSAPDYNVISDQEVTGNVVSLIEASWELVRPHLTETRFSGNALFKTQIIYPEPACREALINAIAHRDYSIEGRGVELSVYTDRLELVSPGSLLSTIRIDDLVQGKGVHQSRNALIARVLREVGYMRELGEGMRRIFDLMNASDLAAPELHSTKTAFQIALRHKFTYSREEKLWLDNFERLGLSREQRIVVRLGYGGHVISASEIWEAVGIVDTDAYRRLVESLRAAGILKDAISRDTAYRLAHDRKVSRKSIPRYVVVPPSQAVTTSEDATVEVGDDSDYARLFLANLPADADEDELLEALSQFGTVVSLQLPRAFPGGIRRGYGFVEFDRVEDAQAVLSGAVEVRGRKLVVQKAKPQLARKSLPRATRRRP